MEKTIVSSVTTSDHHYSNGRASTPMCLRCYHCAQCNCSECQLKLCIEYCTTCRCFWRPSFCTVCGKLTGYTQTFYPPEYGCTKPAGPNCCSPSCCPPMCCPPSCSCMSTCSPPRPPPDCCCVQTVSLPSRRTGYTQTCYRPPTYNPCPAPTSTAKTYCYICHKYV